MEQRTRNLDAGHGWVTDVQRLQLVPVTSSSTTSTAEPINAGAASGDDTSSSDDDAAFSSDEIMLTVAIVLVILLIAGLASNYHSTLLRLKKSSAPITENPGFVHPTQGLVIHKTPGTRPAPYGLPSAPYSLPSAPFAHRKHIDDVPRQPRPRRAQPCAKSVIPVSGIVPGHTRAQQQPMAKQQQMNQPQQMHQQQVSARMVNFGFGRAEGGEGGRREQVVTS